MQFEDRYFKKLEFSPEQIKQNLDNASRDLHIAKEDSILEVKFNYAYTALIKLGIALLSSRKVKIKSVPGHHVKIIEKAAEILDDSGIATMGNLMRSKRNLDFYGGGIEVTEKECAEFVKFAELSMAKAKAFLAL